jgi:2-polyprenyl-6-methoxyphenol hydroxylase-like FAD-dependent oxidoreductase
MKIIIIGGSIAGLCAGIALLEKGFDVEIYERARGTLKDRGAGLVIQSDMLEYLVEHGISTRTLFGVRATQRQVLDDDGSVLLVYPNDTFFTSWNYLWNQLKSYFPSSRYFSDFELTGLEDREGKISATFKNGELRTADLLLGADGLNSRVREYVSPATRPEYAGYVAYRGLIPEEVLTAEEIKFFSDKFSIYSYEGSHMLCYTIPGPDGELAAGGRLLNWVWYQNKSEDELRKLMTDKDGKEREFTVPAGFLSEESKHALISRADAELPRVLSERIHQTVNPFVQVIADMGVEKMYKGAVALLGDAANLVRPHTASGSAKAYRDAITLATSLQADKNLGSSLEIWNEHEIKHARALDIHGRQLAFNNQLGTFKPN